jgi:hypothetical protein
MCGILVQGYAVTAQKIADTGGGARRTSAIAEALHWEHTIVNKSGRLGAPR